jgi:predicted AlkP superfamily phosphohydrolase/phosphomutase
VPDLGVPTVYPATLAERWEPVVLQDTSARTEALFEERFRAVQREASFTIDLFREYDVDLGIYYTNFVDTVSHTNWDFYARDKFLLARTPVSLSDEEWAELVLDNLDDRVFNVYTRIDTIVSDFAAAFPGATLILASDHGWTFSGYEHFGSPDGVVMLGGPRIRPGAELEDAHILDVAPTALALIDVPLSAELAGRVLSEAFSAELVTSSIAAYDPPGGLADGRQEVELDDAEIERLKTLGYVE